MTLPLSRSSSVPPADEDYVSIREFEPLTRVGRGKPEKHWLDKLTPEQRAEHEARLRAIVDAQVAAQAEAHKIWVVG